MIYYKSDFERKEKKTPIELGKGTYGPKNPWNWEKGTYGPKMGISQCRIFADF